ncbi:DUF3943 domain-containing protein [Myxococcota bacterium]|nr:DUF3943 domain-containing protein [Myxococcota bacterium]
MISSVQIALIVVLGTSPEQPAETSEPTENAILSLPTESSATSEQPLKTDEDNDSDQKQSCKQPPKQHSYLAPALFIPVVNTAYWLPSWLLNADFAQINLDTMRGNFAHGMVIDEDNFTTNQFGHPYQGGSYFNTARTFGLSFWEAVPYTAAGSLMWEYLMESGPACCYPSINDFLTTTIGGIAAGEVLWRLSNALLDDSATGSERALREIGAFALNPPHGMHRLLNGDAFALGAAPVRKHRLFGEVSLGGSIFGSNGSTDDFAWVPRVRLRHGEPGEMDADFKPFDHFTLDLALGFHRTEVVGATFDVLGITNGTKFDLWGKNNAVVGIGFDFDFFENVLVALGQSAFGGVIMLERPVAANWDFWGRATLMASYGGITTDYPDIRNYNLGVGATSKLWLELRHESRGELYLKLDRYWINTMSGHDGDEFAGVLDVGGTYDIFRHLGVGMHVLFADKSGIYYDYPSTLETIFFGEAYIAWRL